MIGAGVLAHFVAGIARLIAVFLAVLAGLIAVFLAVLALALAVVFALGNRNGNSDDHWHRLGAYVLVMVMLFCRPLG